MTFNPADYGATPVGKTKTFNPADYGATSVKQAAPPAPKPSLSESLWNGLAIGGEVAKGVGKTAASFLGQADTLGTLNRLQKGDTTDLNGQKIVSMLDSANPLKTMHQLAGDTTSPFAAPVSVPQSQTPDWTGMSPADREQANQPSNYAQKVGQTATIVGLNALPFAGEAIPKFKEAAGTIKDSLTPKPPTPEDVAARQAADAAQVKAETAVKVQRVADEWTKPTVPGKASNPASFNKATDVLATSPNTPTFLAEQKLSPAQHIENGRYATADSATALRDTAGKMSSDALRPSLQQADYITAKTPVAEVVKNAIAEARKDPNITPGSLETVIRNINKEGGALQRKFPDGMSLENMHDNKITYAKNGGYKPTSIADNNTATMNRNIASSLQRLVETKAPKDIPVEDFNKYMSQYYKAADYLDELNTKKAPVSLLQNVAHRAAQVVGAGVGHTVGGGILGGVGGYMIGGALEHALENLALPMRDAFLKNLKITKPEVYQKVVDFIGQEDAARATRLALPEGAIQLGSEADTSGVKLIPAKKSLPTANPDTGRMQKTYTSTPE